jgi:hypothetical protein
MMAQGEVSSLAEARELISLSFEPKRYEPNQSNQWIDAYATMLEIRKRRG